MILTVRQKEIITGLFCILFFLGGALAGEVALRLVSLSKFGMTDELNERTAQANQPKQKKFFKDPNSGLRLPYPNQQLGLVRINNFGFRGPDNTLQKSEKMLRVAFLGSSTTYDANVAEGKNWPHLTATKLEQQLQGCSTDFINAGLPGYSTQHMEKYWETTVNQFEADLVILLPGDMTNDIQSAAKEAGFSGHTSEKSWLSKHSLLWQKIEKNVDIIKAQRAAFNATGKFIPDLDLLTDNFERRLNAAIDTLEADNTYLVLSTISSRVRPELSQEEQIRAANSALYFMPYLSIPTLLDAQEQYNQVIRKVARQRGVHLIEGEDRIPPDDQHFVDSRHFNSAGSKVMSKRIVEGLTENGALNNYIKERVTGCTIKPQNSL